MNAARRNRIGEALDILKEVKREEEEAYDNLPQSFQDGAQGQTMQENIDALDSAIDELEPIANA